MIAKMKDKKDNVLTKDSLAQFQWELIIRHLVSFHTDMDIWWGFQWNCHVPESTNKNEIDILRVNNWKDASSFKSLTTIYL